MCAAEIPEDGTSNPVVSILTTTCCKEIEQRSEKVVVFNFIFATVMKNVIKHLNAAFFQIKKKCITLGVVLHSRN